MDIIKIIIKGYSGFGWIMDSYEESLVLTKSSISFIHNPSCDSPSPENTYQKWSYKAESNHFSEIYDKIVAAISEVVKSVDIMALDAPGLKIILIYSNQRKEMFEFWGGKEYFLDSFTLLQSLIPPCERIPHMMI